MVIVLSGASSIEQMKQNTETFDKVEKFHLNSWTHWQKLHRQYERYIMKKIYSDERIIQNEKDCFNHRRN